MAAGLLGFLGIAIASMLTSSLRGQKAIEVRDAVRLMETELLVHLANQAACTASLRNLNPKSPGSSVSALKRADDSLYVSLGDLVQNRMMKLSQMNLSAYTPDHVSSPLLGKSKLLLTFEPLGDPVGPKIFAREITLATTINSSDQLTSCSAISSSGSQYWLASPTLTNGIYTAVDAVGIGTTNPLRRLAVEGTSIANGSYRTISVNEPSAGNESVSLGYDANGTIHTTGFLRSNNNLPLSLGTLTTPTAVTVLDGGNVGIGTTNPSARLDVAGELKVGNSGVACSAAREGQVRYNSTVKSIEFCNGANWIRAGSGLRVESGSNEVPNTCSDAGSYVAYESAFFCTSGAPAKSITFSSPFTSPPRIIVSLAGASADGSLLPCTGGAMDQVGLSYDSVTTSGFRALAWMSPFGTQCGAWANYTGPIRFSWMAIGQ
jgi:hypothetical protein